MTESELLYATIAMHHNNKIIEDALDVLKQFTKHGNIYLYNDNEDVFEITKNTKVCVWQDM